ncbi:MAG TPA: FxsA family protein [Nitrospirae bacterium]|nr:FxsA family protein [Nitrospirota bacterium]
MFFRLFLLFTLIPVIELTLLIKVGSIIGTLNTVFIVILTAIIGAYMVRLEGIGVMYRIQQDMREGIFPAEELINGMMILTAGALLLTPGFFTDVIGFLMVFPVSRNYIKKIAKPYIKKKMNPDVIEIDISDQR